MQSTLEQKVCPPLCGLWHEQVIVLVVEVEVEVEVEAGAPKSRRPLLLLHVQTFVSAEPMLSKQYWFTFCCKHVWPIVWESLRC